MFLNCLNNKKTSFCDGLDGNSGKLSLSLSIIVLLDSLKKVLILYSISKFVITLPDSELFFIELSNYSAYLLLGSLSKVNSKLFSK